MTRQPIPNPSSSRLWSTRHRGAFRWVLLGGWLLMMPPVPMGTALPPLSEWSRVSEHKTSDDCGRRREAMRETARLTVTRGANASALEVASALGQLEARCVEVRSAEPVDQPAADKPAGDNPAADQSAGDKPAVKQ